MLIQNYFNNPETLFQDDTYLAFKDIKPAATHHYLIIPRKHIKNTSSLRASDLDLGKITIITYFIYVLKCFMNLNVF